MNATMELKPLSWAQPKPQQSIDAAKSASQAELSCLLRNADSHDLVAALREASTLAAPPGKNARRTEERLQAALDLQAQLRQLLEDRETLESEIKRGHECLETARDEIAGFRLRLEDWATFERHCGRNPLLDYAHAILANARVQAFLPGWLKRREKQLHSINRRLERCARRNGLQHLI